MTAQIIAGHCGRPVHPNPDLRERDWGRWAGRSNVDLKWAGSPERGETLEQFVTRTLRGVNAALENGKVTVVAHGGTFAKGDCESHAFISQAFARCGMAVIDTPFRQGAEAPHPGALRDLADVAAFARAAWGARVPLGVAGSSSGGYYARSPRRRGRRG